MEESKQKITFRQLSTPLKTIIILTIIFIALYAVGITATVIAMTQTG